jgi:hypothetical protein
MAVVLFSGKKFPGFQGSACEEEKHPRGTNMLSEENVSLESDWYMCSYK